jgi:hypothetical protein
MDYRTSRKAVQREVAASSKEVTLNLLLVSSHFFFCRAVRKLNRGIWDTAPPLNMNKKKDKDIIATLVDEDLFVG